MKVLFPRLFCLLVCLGFSPLSPAPAQAQLLYDAKGWEAAAGPPNWNLGNILGQNAWLHDADPANDPTAPNIHQVVGSITLGALTINPKTGARMHQSISTASTGAWTFTDLTTAFANRTAGNNTVVVSLDTFLPASDAASDHFHGIDSYDTTLSRLGVAWFQNNVPAFGGLPGFFLAGSDEGEIGAPFARSFLNDAWHQVTLVLDFDTKRIEAYLDKTQFAIEEAAGGLAFDRTLIDPFASGSVRAFADADLMSFPGTTPTSHFFTDNYKVSAARSITFEGTLALDALPNLADAQSLVRALFELRNANGTVRTGYVSVRTPAADGTYSVRLFDVPDGTYQLCVRVPCYLSRMVSLTVSGTEIVPVPALTMLGGDANGDDSVDVLDLDALLQAFDSVEGDPNYDPGADFDYSDSVDVLDLATVIRNFDEAGECP